MAAPATIPELAAELDRIAHDDGNRTVRITGAGGLCLVGRVAGVDSTGTYVTVNRNLGTYGTPAYSSLNLTRIIRIEELGR